MKDYLNSFATRHNLVRQLDSTSVVLESKKILPTDLSPISFRAGVLNIEVQNQTARHFYESKKEEFRKNINESLGEEKVKEIKLRIAS